MNRLIRAARTQPDEAPVIKRVHSTATGATDGNIIAAIITTQTPRKGSRARPIVPGPLPMLSASAMVTTQAAAASAARAIHGRASWRRGRLCTGRARAADPAWLAMTEPRQPS